MLKRFNVRVYGLMVNEYGEVLVADEQFKSGIRATKFPGGGLELGEGTREGLQREFMEETGIDVVIEDHFYTTDYFQPSFYDDHSQLISIYYVVSSSALAKHSDCRQAFRLRSAAWARGGVFSLGHFAATARRADAQLAGR
jgi:8-oxo-dGTP pyrophosphatase MutT (NUDIX family)